MVASYAFGAPGGILAGTRDLTSALLGYPLALDAARQRREASDMQKEDRIRQQQRQDLADAFLAESHKSQMASDAQRMQIERNKGIFGGLVDVPPAHDYPTPEPLSYDPVQGTPHYDPNAPEGMMPDTFEQALARAGQQTRGLNSDRELAQIDREKELTAAKKGAAGKPPNPKTDREVWEYHIDPETKKAIKINKVTGERVVYDSLAEAKKMEGSAGESAYQPEGLFSRAGNNIASYFTGEPTGEAMTHGAKGPSTPKTMTRAQVADYAATHKLTPDRALEILTNRGLKLAD